MPIEFHCTACNQLLRVPDDAAGRKAQCPGCDAVLDIPAAAAEPPPVEPLPTEPPPGPIIGGSAAPARDDSYLSPASERYSGPVVDGPIVPTRIDLGSVLSESWRIFKDHMWLLVGAFFIIAVINWGYNIGLTLFDLDDADFLLNFVLQLFGQVLSLFMSLGQAILVLNVVCGREASLNDLFRGGPYLLRAIGASIVFCLIVMLGVIALIVPGIILALMLGQYYFLIVDKNVGAMESLSISRRITSGNKGTLFLPGFVMMGLAILGLLAFVIGIAFAGAFTMVTAAVAYRMMAGLPVADH